MHCSCNNVSCGVPVFAYIWECFDPPRLEIIVDVAWRNRTVAVIVERAFDNRVRSLLDLANEFRRSRLRRVPKGAFTTWLQVIFDSCSLVRCPGIRSNLLLCDAATALKSSVGGAPSTANASACILSDRAGRLSLPPARFLAIALSILPRISSNKPRPERPTLRRRPPMAPPSQSSSSGSTAALRRAISSFRREEVGSPLASGWLVPCSNRFETRR